jgi:hypothetical protein
VFWSFKKAGMKEKGQDNLKFAVLFPEKIDIFAGRRFKNRYLMFGRYL